MIRKLRIENEKQIACGFEINQNFFKYMEKKRSARRKRVGPRRNGSVIYSQKR